MPHITTHARKVSSRAVYLYACERLRKEATARHTRQTDHRIEGLSKTTFFDLLMVVHIVLSVAKVLLSLIYFKPL